MLRQKHTIQFVMQIMYKKTHTIHEHDSETENMLFFSYSFFNFIIPTTGFLFWAL